MVVELPTALYMTPVKELCHGSRVAHSPLYDSCERALSCIMVVELPTALYMTPVKELCHV